MIAANVSKPLSERSEAWLVNEGRRLRHNVTYCRRVMGEDAWRTDVAQLALLRAEWRARHPDSRPAQADLISMPG